MDSRRRWRVGPALRIALGLALGLWAAGPAGAGPSFDGQGRIIAVDPGRSTVTIEHGGIPGLLPAAQSEFPVQGVVQGVRPGDRVRFTLGAMDESHGLLTVLSLTPESAAGAGWLDRLLVSAAAALALLALAAMAAVGVLLWRELRSLQRRTVALDHEVGMLRGLVTDTQDGVHQIARALDEAATALRVGYVQQLRRRLVPGSPPAKTETAGDKETGAATGALVVVQRGRGDLYQRRGGRGSGTRSRRDLGPSSQRAAPGRAAPDRPRAPPHRATGLAPRDVDAARVSARAGRHRRGRSRSAGAAVRKRRARRRALTPPTRPEPDRSEPPHPRGRPPG